jgi:pimeloyl-ACP methyl ester carboxylesterase
VRQPTLLLADPQDAVIPVEATYQLAAAMPDARVELLHNIGHHLPVRGAAKTAARITQFLAALDGLPATA